MALTAANYISEKVLKFLGYLGFNFIDTAEHYGEELIDAAYMGSLDKVKYYLSLGADINFNNYNYNTGGAYAPLHHAAERGHLEIVKFLVLHGAIINTAGFCPLQLAAKNNHLAIVKFLVLHGADIYHVNNLAVKFATSRRNLAIVKFLVLHGADVHEINRIASYNGYLEIICHLVLIKAPIAFYIYNQLSYVRIYMKHYKRREILAASRIYFWWIPQCYDMSRPSGIRMAYANLKAYESMCVQ